MTFEEILLIVWIVIIVAFQYNTYRVWRNENK